MALKCKIKYINEPRPIMLNFLPIMLLSNAQKFAYHVHIMPMITAIMPQFVHDFYYS